MTTDVRAKETVAAYRRFFETVTPDKVDDVRPLISEDARFVDPFNDVTGCDLFVGVIARMFEDLDDPRFEMLGEFWSADACILEWRMTARQRHLGHWEVEGLSELRFDPHGRITLHRDYWDSGTQFYGRLPLLRHVIAFIRRKAALR